MKVIHPRRLLVGSPGKSKIQENQNRVCGMKGRTTTLDDDMVFKYVLFLFHIDSPLIELVFECDFLVSPTCRTLRFILFVAAIDPLYIVLM